ncbi:putative C6 zinc finger domain-containing protein [Seiridium cardinale]|uniref:C6 zinc finger domain-containing protein n=1 Tax=Seiridium cardinale TaxID=138064 RepID=A0ABR2XJM8_9PEZI
MYVLGLEELQKALNNQRTRLSDETLAACLTLSFYELAESTTGMQSAHLAHRRGAMLLLELRGPMASTTPLGHSLFLALRAQAITPCLMYNFETFFSEPEWITTPWNMTRKDPYDQVMDLLFEVSTILRQSDRLSEEKDQSLLHNHLCGHIAKYHDIECSLRTMYRSFEESISGPLYWAELSNIVSSADDSVSGKLFPVSFQFPSFTVAHFLAMYWTAMMVTHLQLMLVYTRLARVESTTAGDSKFLAHTWPSVTGRRSHPSISPSLRADEHIIEFGSMVKNICQSVEFFLQDDMGGFGRIVILSQIHGSLDCMQSNREEWSNEIKWVLELIQRIEERLDFPVAGALAGTAQTTQLSSEGLRFAVIHHNTHQRGENMASVFYLKSLQPFRGGTVENLNFDTDAANNFKLNGNAISGHFAATDASGFLAEKSAGPYTLPTPSGQLHDWTYFIHGGNAYSAFDYGNIDHEDAGYWQSGSVTVALRGKEAMSSDIGASRLFITTPNGRRQEKPEVGEYRSSDMKEATASHRSSSSTKSYAMTDFQPLYAGDVHNSANIKSAVSIMTSLSRIWQVNKNEKSLSKT